MVRESRTRQSLTLFTLAFAILGATIGLSLEPVLLNDADATTVCTSGSVSTDSSQSPLVVVTFTAPGSGNGSCTWTVPENVYSVDYVVVAGGGGGASDVRLNGTALGDRIITAGGGGGSESHCGLFFSAGGNAGSNGEAGQGYSTTIITQFWHNFGYGATLAGGGGGGFFNFSPT